VSAGASRVISLRIDAIIASRFGDNAADVSGII
jgi:hypothetical protein